MVLETLSFDSSLPLRAPSAAAAGSVMAPSIGPDGRILLPGVSTGLSLEAYFPLVHLYASVLEADRLLDAYRPQLSQLPGVGFGDPLTPLQASPGHPGLWYKREDLTVTRAYKVRGAVVAMAKLMESQQCQHFTAVSTGNHALGVLKAAQLLRPQSVRLVVPVNTTVSKRQKIESQLNALRVEGVQAFLTVQGQTFDEARAWAMSQGDGEAYYLDPYSDPWVVAGQGTIGLELYRQLARLMADQGTPESITVVAPIGGGGLLGGTATALRLAAAWDSRFRNVTLRFEGLRLADLASPLGDAIRVQTVSPGNQRLFEALGVHIQPMTDEDMAQGVAWVAQELGCRVEGASGGTVKPWLETPQAGLKGHTHWTVSVLSGANCHE